MPEDRRSARRAPLSGVRVTYEGATGLVHEAPVANLSREGLFIATADPTAVGKRLSLDIQVAGEAGSWPALGRVVWLRAEDEWDLPAGMAVKIIDIEESIAAAIDRLIEARERTEPGLGGAEAAPPTREKPLRERTMIGVGIPIAPPEGAAPPPPVSAPREEPPAPIAQAARALPSREKTMLGVGRGAAGADPREPSVAIDLVGKKAPSVRPPESRDEPEIENVRPTRSARDSRESEPIADRRVSEFEKVAGPADEGASGAPTPARRSGVGWLLLLVLVLASGGAAYAFRDRLLPIWRAVVTEVNSRLR